LTKVTEDYDNGLYLPMPTRIKLRLRGLLDR
jgi:hypothetical protein